ncbi:MAG TPA: M24 family metallopeptidase, partial [Bacteroidota bacterium]
MNSVLGETVLTESDPTKGSRAIKRKRVVEFLDRQNLDGVLLTLQSNFAWYTDGARGHTNIASEESIAELLVTRAEEHLFVNAIESRRLTTEELRWNAPVVHINAWWDDPSRRSLVKKEFGSRIVYDSGALRQEFARLRYSLLPHEIERYRALGRDVAGVFWDIIPTLKPGMAEFDLAAEISGRLLRKGVEAIVLLVAFDERAKAYRHPIATMNTLKKVALVSVCGRRHGLIASATRQYVLGGVSEEFRLKHAAVARVDAWLLHETAPNLRVAELFRGLKEQYASVGYP